jgi:threonine dehydrogenase-like Zn-dependent dehydrogenase
MTTMSTLVCAGPGIVEWRSVLAPRLQAAEQALVRPLVVATCDIDAPMIAGETPYRGIIELGHECIAEVVEIGAAVTKVAVGDRVVVPFQVSCGSCAACRRGHSGSCAAVPAMTMFGFGVGGGGQGGAFSDVLRVPFADAMLVPFPSALDPTHWASLADNLPDAYRAIAPALAAWPGAEVLVVGGQCVSIGLYCVDLARALGAAAVRYLDPDRDRCERAARLRADVVCAPYPASVRTAPITVDASASVEGLACALRSTAPNGLCASTGGYFTATTPIPLRDLYMSIGTLATGRCHARPALEPLLELACAGRLSPACVTAQIAPFGDAAEVLAEGRRHKLVFTRDELSPSRGEARR